MQADGTDSSGAGNLHPEDEILYSSSVTSVGSMVADFVSGHGILVFFGHDAPEELHDIAVLHRATVTLAGPQVGDVIELGDARIPVLAVGPVVEANLINLGHIDFKANGKTNADLPGDVCVPEHSLPRPEVGAIFRIVRPTAAAAPQEMAGA